MSASAHRFAQNALVSLSRRFENRRDETLGFVAKLILGPFSAFSRNRQFDRYPHWGEPPTLHPVGGTTHWGEPLP